MYVSGVPYWNLIWMKERKKERALIPYRNSECGDQQVDSEGTHQAELISRLI